MTSDSATRSERFPEGIVGARMGEVERQIPADEPPPLPVNSELKVIGKSVPRINGRAKVTGAIRYTADVKLPGMLFGRILRSPHPHAEIRTIDTSAAEKLPGVRAVLVLAKPGDPQRGAVRYVGQPVAALAAVNADVAAQGLSLIRVDYRPRAFVVGLEAAMQPESPKVYASDAAPKGSPSGFPAPADLPLDGNVRGPSVLARGDVEAGLVAAEVTVEGEYRTQVQTHCCMEPHGLVADWRDDGLTVYQSTQATASVRHELSQDFNLPLEKVRVIVDGMGGGFGSKSSLGSYGRIAVGLSRLSSAPVRLMMVRWEEHLDTGNRPATLQRLKIGAKRDGTLTGIKLESFGTAGVGLGAGVGNVAAGLYTCANFASAQHDVFINGGPGSAMRGPGNTPGAFAMELAIDELAEKLGLDPLVLRDRNDPSEVRREERRLGAERIGWSARHAPGADSGTVKRGLGVAQSLWSANVSTESYCEVRLTPEGRIEARSGVQDIGPGVGTVIAQTVAETLGLQAQDIVIHIGDTQYPPGPPSHGSRTTASITPAARSAAWKLRQAMVTAAARELNATPDDIVIAAGKAVSRKAPERSLSFSALAQKMPADALAFTAKRADDYGGYKRKSGENASAQQDLGGVQFAEVAIDAETGIIRVERVVAVQDCGRPINPRLIESQVQGGVLMGVSYALYEERLLDAFTGRMVNSNLEQYRLIGSREAPLIEVVALENYQGRSATDAYGIAEPSNIATAPAIANAVYNAIGVRLRALPMTPAAVLTALGRVPLRS